MKIEIAKDKDGFIAKVSGRKNLIAFGYTKREALEELLGVAETELESDQEIRQIEKKVQEHINRIENEG